MTDWDGMNEDKVQRRLDEAFTRLRAVAAAEEHVLLEQMAADTPVHSWPPAPNTAHPSSAAGRSPRGVAAHTSVTGCSTPSCPYPTPKEI